MLLVTERDIKEEILQILRRRPLSLSDLSKGMGIPQNELDQYIKPLIQEGKIKTRIFGDSVYYEIGEKQIE
jgi:DNA-binding IclR family transcriptional regulator